MRLTKSLILTLLIFAPALLSAQTATVARYAIGKKVSVTQGTSNNTVSFDTKVFDTDNFVPAGSDPSEFTAPKAGYYNVYVTVSAQAAGGAAFNAGYAYSLHLFKAGVDQGAIGAFYAAGDKATQGVAQGSLMLNLQKGQQINIKMNANKEGSDSAPVNFDIPGNATNPSSWIQFQYIGE